VDLADRGRGEKTRIELLAIKPAYVSRGELLEPHTPTGHGFMRNRTISLWRSYVEVRTVPLTKSASHRSR